jgi:malate synthase
VDGATQRQIRERISQWKPHEVWFEREQMEFQELMRKGADVAGAHGEVQEPVSVRPGAVDFSHSSHFSV